MQSLCWNEVLAFAALLELMGSCCPVNVLYSICRWLLYEEPGFQGIPLMLEPGEYPDLSFWEKKEAYIRSMRPLKMVMILKIYIKDCSSDVITVS